MAHVATICCSSASRVVGGRTCPRSALSIADRKASSRSFSQPLLHAAQTSRTVVSNRRVVRTSSSPYMRVMGPPTPSP